jgi:hypothetical protein
VPLHERAWPAQAENAAAGMHRVPQLSLGGAATCARSASSAFCNVPARSLSPSNVAILGFIFGRLRKQSGTALYEDEMSIPCKAERSQLSHDNSR